VHGIQGHPQKTWLHDGHGLKQPKPSASSWRTRLKFKLDRAQSSSNTAGQAPQQPVYWPQDLLPRDCPNARIMTFGYDSMVTRGYVAADKGSIFSHARDLLYALNRVRERGRRLLFVAHSLGGIIVKEVRVSTLAIELPVGTRIAH
jgi:protein SERAC1